MNNLSRIDVESNRNGKGAGPAGNIILINREDVKIETKITSSFVGRASKTH